LALLAASACAFETAPDTATSDLEGTAAKEQAVFGGEPATKKRYKPIGAIAIRYVYEEPGQPPFVYFNPICSATLVDDKAIVTARHCTQALANYEAEGNPGYFLIGDDTTAPEQVLRIQGWKEAPSSPSHPGLLFDGGRDVAVAYLQDCPRKVEPAKIGEFKPKMVKDKFEIVGYGWNDSLIEEYGPGAYTIGTRFAGNVKGRALSGAWYPLLFNGDYDAYLEWYFTDAVTGSPSEEEAAAWWEAFTLEPNYELLAGGREGEALGCNGDSGGPLLLKEKDLTVVGISFAVESSQSTICTLGGGYLVFNKEMKRFVESALKHRH